MKFSELLNKNTVPFILKDNLSSKLIEIDNKNDFIKSVIHENRIVGLIGSGDDSVCANAASSMEIANEKPNIITARNLKLFCFI